MASGRAARGVFEEQTISSPRSVAADVIQFKSHRYARS